MTPTERLQELSRLLREDVPADQFSLKAWLVDSIGEGFALNYDADPKDLDPHTCNTVACAVGWAMYHPPFNAEGLKPTILFEPSPFAGERPLSIVEPEYKGMDNWDAVRKFFGIDAKVSDYLFMWQGKDYTSPTQVADRIDEVVEHKGKGERLDSEWDDAQQKWVWVWRKG